MIVIQLQGGLGNQMFQYAIASILAKRNKTNVLIDECFYKKSEKTLGITPRKFELDIFENNYKKATDSDINSFLHLSTINKLKIRIGLNFPKTYNEPSFDFQTDVLSIKPPVYLKGYFQSYKYFIGHEDLIRQLFTFPLDKLDKENYKLLNTINTSNSTAIHLRRGDYVNNKFAAAYHGSCSLDYYYRAIKIIESKNKEFNLVFFSDDNDWVKEQFKDLPYSKIFIDNNKNENSWKDLLLMSSCRYNIIANSSFSWWAAWLNENKNKIVIAPEKWFFDIEVNNKTNDLIPEEWHRI